MKNKFKSLFKTTAAIAALIAGSQTWGAAINIAALAADGTLVGSKPYHGSVTAATGSTLVVPDKAVVALNANAVTMASGGGAAIGGTFTMDVGATGWTIYDVVATKNLNLFIRAATAGTAIAAFTISNLVLADKAEEIKVWTSDITALTTTAISYEAKPGRGFDTLVLTDVASPAPTMKVGGRTYTLSRVVSVK